MNNQYRLLFIVDPTSIINKPTLEVGKVFVNDTELKSILIVAARLWDKGLITEDGLVE